MALRRIRTVPPDVEVPGGPVDPTATPRRTRVAIRRIEPWSVLRVSLLFYLCVMLIVTVAMVIVYSGLRLTGILDAWSVVLGEFLGAENFQINGAWLLSRFVMIGLGGVVLWSMINVVVAVLYNRVADVVGGIQVTMTRRR